MREIGIGYNAGGLRDQPAGFVRRARLYDLVIVSMREWRRMSLKRFDTVASFAMREAVKMVLAMRTERAKQKRTKGSRG